MEMYVVRLTENQRQELHRLIKKRKGSAYKCLHAQILLNADCSDRRQGLTDEEISEALKVCRTGVERVRRCFVEQGLKAALNMENWDRQLGSKHKTLEKICEELSHEEELPHEFSLSWDNEVLPLLVELDKELKKSDKKGGIHQSFGKEISIQLDSGIQLKVHPIDGRINENNIWTVRDVILTAGIKLERALWWTRLLPK